MQPAITRAVYDRDLRKEREMLIILGTFILALVSSFLLFVLFRGDPSPRKRQPGDKN